MTVLPAIQKKCCDCPRLFVMTSKEREFYRMKGLMEPRRCKPCRSARRELRGGTYHPIGGEHQRTAE